MLDVNLKQRFVIDIGIDKAALYLSVPLHHSSLCNGRSAVNIQIRTLELQKINLFIFLQNMFKGIISKIQLSTQPLTIFLHVS